MLSKRNQSNVLVQFGITVLAAGVIFPLLYLRQNFEVSILTTFDIELSQLSFCYSILGIIFAATYLPSGWLADRVSCKKLIIISLLATSLLGFWFSSIPSYQSIIIIFCGWGLSTGLTFWSSHLKLVAILAGKKQQGRFFGLLDGGRGLVEAILATFAVSIFAFFMGDTDQNLVFSLKSVIYMYVFAILLVIPLVFIFLDSNEQNADVTEENISSKRDFIEIIQNKNIWLCTVCIICGYQLFWATYSFSGYLQDHLGYGAVTVGSITVAKLWMRPLGAISAGFVGDLSNPTKLLGILMILASIALASLPFLSSYNLALIIGIVLIIGLLTYGVRGIYWATLDKCAIENRTKGLAIGFISMVAYLPDIYLPFYRSWLLEIYATELGYMIYYTSLALIGLLGALAAFKLMRQ